MGKVIKLHKKIKLPVVYKYRINELVKNVPWNTQIVLEDLEDLGISKYMFYRDSNIPAKSTKSIPGDRLVKYAGYFEVSVEELYSEPINEKNITPLR